MKKITSIFLFTIFVTSAQCYAVDPLPDYWSQWEVEKGTFTAGIDKETYRSKPDSLTIRNDSKSKSAENSRSGICQTIKIDKYLGKRIRYFAYIKTKNLEQWAYTYARSGKIYPFEGIKGDKSKGVTKDWTPVSLVFNIHKNHNKDRISLCFSLWEGGQMWVDDIKWEIVDDSVPLTYKVTPKLDEPILK